MGAAAIAGVATFLLLIPHLQAKAFVQALQGQDVSALMAASDVSKIQANREQYYARQLQEDVAAGNTESRLLRLGESMAPLLVERYAWEDAQPNRWKLAEDAALEIQWVALDQRSISDGRGTRWTLQRQSWIQWRVIDVQPAQERTAP